jgi:hypothetical protein
MHNSDTDDEVGGSLAVRKSEAIRDSNIDVGDPGIKLDSVFPWPSEFSAGKLDERLAPI